MAVPPVTIAVVPSQRFSLTKRSLDSILAHSDPASELIYIDGGSPPLVRQYLEQQAARRGFQLISTERYVAPNVARNLAVAAARGKYVLFVDNDTLVSPGWFEPLVDCAEATDAWMVGPLCCQGEWGEGRIHSAGGDAEIIATGRRRALRLSQPQRGEALRDVGPSLSRQLVGHVELHAALVRRDVLHRIGPFDERLLSAAESLDLALLIRRLGGKIYLEPGSVVSYLPPPPFDAFDLDYFQLRYSDTWIDATLEWFRHKWELPADDAEVVALARQLRDHRRLTIEPFRRVLRWLGRAPAQWIEQVLIAPFEGAANRRRYPTTPHVEGYLFRKAA